MKAKELKELLKNVPNDMDVVIGLWFEPVISADIKNMGINGKIVTAFQLISDIEDMDDMD